MNVRFKMINKGEVAILPREEFGALAAKARRPKTKLLALRV